MSLSRINLDRLGEPHSIVHPTFDDELNDPAYAPAGTMQIDVPRFEYSGTVTRRALLAMLQPKLAAAGRTVFANLMQKRIDLIDAVELVMAAENELAALVEAGGTNPKPAQQLAINVSRAKLTQLISDAQAIRSDIANIVALLP